MLLGSLLSTHSPNVSCLLFSEPLSTVFPLWLFWNACTNVHPLLALSVVTTKPSTIFWTSPRSLLKRSHYLAPQLCSSTRCSRCQLRLLFSQLSFSDVRWLTWTPIFHWLNNSLARPTNISTLWSCLDFPQQKNMYHGADNRLWT